MHSNSLRTLAILTVRNEARYLVDWLAYHLAIGFDNVIVTSNDNTDGSDALLVALDRHGFITYIDNNMMMPEFDKPRGLQHRAYWLATGHPLFLQHDWCSFIDADEFIVPKKHADIKSFLADYEDVSAIAMNWRNFGSSHLEAYDDRPVYDRFTWAASKDFQHNGLTKVLFRPADIVRKPFHTGPHFVTLREGAMPYRYASGAPFKSYRDPDNIHFDELQLNHYAVKSLGEYSQRSARGAASQVPKYNDNYFQFNDRNDEQDFSILYFAPKAKRMAAFIRSIADIADAERAAKHSYDPPAPTPLEMAPDAPVKRGWSRLLSRAD